MLGLHRRAMSVAALVAALTFILQPVTAQERGIPDELIRYADLVLHDGR